MAANGAPLIALSMIASSILWLRHWITDGVSSGLTKARNTICSLEPQQIVDYFPVLVVNGAGDRQNPGPWRHES